MQTLARAQRRPTTSSPRKAIGRSIDAGESFVFLLWNGEPQCFLDEAALLDELVHAGFVSNGLAPLTEYNAPRPGEIKMGSGPPVIYEGTCIRS